MPTALRITSRLYVTPLLDIHHRPFEKLYRDGVYWSLFKARPNRPMTDHFVYEHLRASLTEADIDGQQAYWLPIIGFHFGRVHGAILSPTTGKPQPDMTTLVRCHNEQAARGYNVGREWYFLEAQPNERTYTDASLLERLRELQHDSVEFHDEEATWYYSLGCILGELSGQLFPATSQEYARWEADRQFWQAEYERTSRQEADTEPLPALLQEA